MKVRENFLFSTEYLDEPNLVFGNEGEDKDPRIGLKRFGPYFFSDEITSLERVNIGIVGTREGMETVKSLISFIQKKYPSQKPNKFLYPDYPGLDEDTPFKCIISNSDNWNSVISEDGELAKIEKMADANERIAYGANLFAEKVKLIGENDNVPDVIICIFPKLVEEYCGISDKTRGAKTAKLTELEKKFADHKKNQQHFLTEWGVEISETDKPPERSYDLRNALKGKIMEYNIPIQILRDSSCKEVLHYEELKSNLKKDPSSFCWNFSTALYYKASGKPWRLAKLRWDTCYVGISFFRDKRHPSNDIQVSMAQVFTHNGEGLVLRGTEVEIDEHTKQPYLKMDQANALLADALAKYQKTARRTPSRVVIHKKTMFTRGEKDGFNDAIYEIGNSTKDFVTIKTDIGINFLRMGKYPVLRGTMIDLGKREFLLYSSGFSPRLRTYSGFRVPIPLHIIHNGESSRKEIASEILGLTKLNWNTTSFSTSMPITLAFAEGVGQILSELPSERKVQHHYRFYM